MPSAREKLTLTDDAIRRLPFAAAARERYTIKDDKLRGLMLLVGTATKSFRLESETRVKRRRVSISRGLGQWPETSTADARRTAQSILGQKADDKITLGPRQGGSFD